MGARTIVTSSSDEKLERARALGAWQTVNYRRTPDWEKAVLEMTEGRGVDLTVEVGGAGTLAQSIPATRIAGTIGFLGVRSEERRVVNGWVGRCRSRGLPLR